MKKILLGLSQLKKNTKNHALIKYTKLKNPDTNLK